MLAGYLQRKEIIDLETVQKVVSKLDLESLVRRPQLKAPEAAILAPVDLSGTAQLAHDLATALNSEKSCASGASPVSGPEPKPGVTVTGTLNERLATRLEQKHEFRIRESLRAKSNSVSASPGATTAVTSAS